MKLCVILAGLLMLTACTRKDSPKPDLSAYTVWLKQPINISFLHEESGIIHPTEKQHISDTISRKWGDGYVSGKLLREWDGDMLVVKSNISEYRIPCSMISHYKRRRPDVTTKYDKETNRHRIVTAQQTPAGDDLKAAPEE